MQQGRAERRLLGREFVRTDGKARVLVPVRMREALGEKVTMTTGLFGELRCHRDDSFWAYGEELLNQCDNHRQQEVISEHVLSVAMPGLEFDPSGRLTIREQFRGETEIDRNTDVVVVWRVEGWMEIWNRAKYDDYRKNLGTFNGPLMEFLESLKLPAESTDSARPAPRRAAK